jgi:hypothetical protein
MYASYVPPTPLLYLTVETPPATSPSATSLPLDLYDDPQLLTNAHVDRIHNQHLSSLFSLSILFVLLPFFLYLFILLRVPAYLRLYVV